MSGTFSKPPATLDWLPERAALRRYVLDRGRAIFEAAGYREISVPLFEQEGLFARTAGDASEVVQKEMYTFTDRGDRRLALRPELTAGIVRAYLEEGLHKEPQPVKLWSAGTVYRYNRAQRGRYREFTQLSIEAIGSADPAVDAEIIALQVAWYQSLGVEGTVLELNSLGDPASRHAYAGLLRDYLDRHAAELSPEVLALRDLNPLRAFDTKDERSRAVLADAPKISEQLTPAARAFFEQVLAYLDARGVAYVWDPTLVRGLDYYTHTAWEVKWPPLGAQSTIGAGGRYDGLAEQIGGPPTPSVGFAQGVERLVMALEDQGLAPDFADHADAYLIVGEQAARPSLYAAMDQARLRGVRVETDYAGRSLKGCRKQAQRLGARIVAVCGPEEWERGVVAIEDHQTNERSEVAVGALADALVERTMT